MQNTDLSHSTIVQALSVYSRITHLDNKAQVFINGENLLNFIQFISGSQPPMTFAVKMLHDMDYRGNIMDKSYFPVCLARQVNVPVLTSYNDVERLHRRFRDFFLGRLLYQPELIEVWDGQNLITSEDAATKFNLIMGKFNGLTFQSSFDVRQIQDLQLVLSIITLPPSYCNPEIDNIYQRLLQNHSITKIFDILYSATSTEFDTINALKCLAYLYCAFPRERFRAYYQGNNFLDPQLWQKIMQTIVHPSPQVKRMVLIVCALLARNILAFNQYIFLDIPSLVGFCSQTQSLSELSGLREALIFYKYWMAGCLKTRDQNNAQMLAQYAYQIFTFAFNMLNAGISNQVNELSLQVICQALVLMPDELNSQSNLALNKLAFTLVEERSLPLAKNILLIIYRALLAKHQKAVRALTSHSDFRMFICKHMINRQSQVHCLIYEILYQLTCNKLQNPIYFKDFFESLLFASRIQLIYSGVMISDIVIRIICNSLSDKWKIELLISSNILTILCQLIKLVAVRDIADIVYLQNTNGIVSAPRPNMHIFHSCITGIYLLFYRDANQPNNSNEQIVQSFNKAIQTQHFQILTQLITNLFSVYDKFIQNSLRQDTIVRRDESNTYKLYKLGSMFCEDLVSNLQNTPHFERARNLKREYLSGIYRFIPIQQLEAEKIPIIILVVIQTPPGLNVKDNRASLRIAKSNYINFNQTVSEFLGIKNFEIRTDTNELIDGDTKYQKILQDMFKNHKTLPSFTLKISVSVNQTQFLPIAYPPRELPDPMYMATYRPRTHFASINAGREPRDLSPLRMSQRKPACRYCHRPQVMNNLSGLCQQCFLNQNIRRF